MNTVGEGVGSAELGVLLFYQVCTGTLMPAGVIVTRIKVHPAAVLGFCGILIVNLTPRWLRCKHRKGIKNAVDA